MSTHLRPGASLGVGWGETVSRVIAATSFGAVGPVHMVTLTGGVEGYLQTILSSKGEIATESADLTSATVIPSPIMASTSALAAALREEPTIQQVLKQACSVEYALVGVGTPTADATIGPARSRIDQGSPGICSWFLRHRGTCSILSRTVMLAIDHGYFQGPTTEQRVDLSIVPLLGYADALDVTAYREGLVGRGVLLDVPRFRGVRWLEPGDV